MRATGLWLAGFSVWVSCSRWQQGSGMSSRLEPCPESRLSHEQVSELSREGVETVNANRMGEHHHSASLEAGMPMLKKAALHGDVDAMSKYASLVLWYGYIDNDGDRFLGRTQWQNAKEGMLFTILAAHRGAAQMDDDAQTFRVLLDPSVPYPDGFFDDARGTAWLVQGWSPAQLDQIREQAYRWRNCWASSS